MSQNNLTPQQALNITTFTSEQLKALAYDVIVEMERVQNNLRLINQELAKRQEAQSAEIQPETKNTKE
jgi:hypothetical protein